MTKTRSAEKPTRASPRVSARHLEDDAVPSRLVFSSQAVDDDGTVHLDGVTTVEFADNGDGTTEITVHASAEGVGAQARSMLDGMTQGWNETLDKLVAFSETER